MLMVLLYDVVVLLKKKNGRGALLLPRRMETVLREKMVSKSQSTEKVLVDCLASLS
jgi:hypothetical protein